MSHPTVGPVPPQALLLQGLWLAGLQVPASHACHLRQAFLLPLQNEASAYGIGHQPKLIVPWFWGHQPRPTYRISGFGQGPMLPPGHRLRVRSSLLCFLHYSAFLPASGPFSFPVNLCQSPHHASSLSSHRVLSRLLLAQLASWSTRTSRTTCGHRPSASTWDPHPLQPSRNPTGCWIDGQAGMCGHALAVIKLWLQMWPCVMWKINAICCLFCLWVNLTIFPIFSPNGKIELYNLLFFS